MKFTLSWLRDHLETEASLEEITQTLNLIGLEVEAVENPAERLGAFRVARVIEARPHPNADKLRVCIVDAGDGAGDGAGAAAGGCAGAGGGEGNGKGKGQGAVQVVCGAPNARTGMIGVFAPTGTYIPGTDVHLKSAKIRGVESHGMLCSERELELSDDHEGIIELPESAAAHVGERYVDVMGLDDPVIEVGITPNRPDALAVRGIARDLAAAGLGRLKKERKGYVKPGTFDCPIAIELDFPEDAAEACPIFAGRLIRGVENRPSPSWLQQRLRAIGLRPINALVDITNYITYDRARPLHVYDAATLKGAIRARLGRRGESFLALDGKTYEVDEEMTVIADDSGVLGLGGVIGGESTGCTEATTDVFIESAYFDPVRTAMTGRRLGIHSDARYRFERGIDPLSAPLGIALATEMILEICGGEPSRVEMAGTPPERNLVIAFDPHEVMRLTGLALKPARIKTILKALGFGIAGKGDALEVAVPSWRPDVHGPADLVEEVIRIEGIDKVPSAPMARTSGVARPVMTEPQKRLRLARRTLAARGMVEAVTWSFIPRRMAEAFGGGTEELTLANPISSEMSDMRPSLLPGLLVAAQRNRDRGFVDLALFEAGQVFHGPAPDAQRTAVAGIRVGSQWLIGGGRHWDGATRAVDLFDAKADLEALLRGLGFDPARAQIVRKAPGWFHPGRSGALKLGPKTTLGVFGVLHPGLLDALDFSFSGPVVGFEMELEALPLSRKKARGKGPLELSDLQPVRRDFAFLLDREVPAAEVVRAARSADKKLISDVGVFDVFEDESLGPDKKSLAIEVTLQPRDETLTEAAIERIAKKIVAAVEKATGGTLRS